jgi:hypothetical protein
VGGNLLYGFLLLVGRKRHEIVVNLNGANPVDLDFLWQGECP